MNNNDFNVQGQFNYFSKTRIVGQCPTWWPPCRIL